MTNNILEVRNVTVSFDGFTVLDNLNFSMERGELRFLIGPNGAGKTTLLDIITGKTHPSAGQVIFDGHVDISRWREHKIVRHGIGRKFQTPSVFNSLTVFENLEAAISFKESQPQINTARCSTLPNKNTRNIKYCGFSPKSASLCRHVISWAETVAGNWDAVGTRTKIITT